MSKPVAPVESLRTIPASKETPIERALSWAATTPYRVLSLRWDALQLFRPEIGDFCSSNVVRYLCDSRGMLDVDAKKLDLYQVGNWFQDDIEKHKARIDNQPQCEAKPDAESGMDWQIAKRLAETHLERNPWPGLNSLARFIKCSPSTMSKARDNSPILRAKEAEHSETRKAAKPSQLAASQRDRLVGDGDVGESVSVYELFNRIIAAEEDPEKRAILENMTPEKRREFVAMIERDPDSEGYFDRTRPAVRKRSRTDGR